jgi:hypothetical protein
MQQSLWKEYLLNIDPKLLAQQREQLNVIISIRPLTYKDQVALVGIQNLLDELQDQADGVKKGGR